MEFAAGYVQIALILLILCGHPTETDRVNPLSYSGITFDASHRHSHLWRREIKRGCLARQARQKSFAFVEFHARHEHSRLHWGKGSKAVRFVKHEGA